MKLAPPQPDLLTAVYAPIRDALEQVKLRFDAEILSRRPPVNALCGQMNRYRGKMLRPALLLLTGKAVGQLTEAHAVLGAVVEMVHIATLVHDDVLDQADLRHQHPTINRLAGNEAAVLVGDYLISHAFHLCSALGSTDAAREIGATTNTVCEGELTQIHHRGNVELGEAEYFEIIAAKTGSLTGSACALGAQFAGGSRECVEGMRRFGSDAGIAFQIIDDVLDLTGSEARTGKSLGRDLDLGKPTLPMIHALAHAPRDARSRLADMISGRSAPDPARVREWLAESCSIAYASNAARDRVRSGARCLEALRDSPARTSLGAMAEFILRREH